jgi:methanol metabolism-related c-type cytochrome
MRLGIASDSVQTHRAPMKSVGIASRPEPRPPHGMAFCIRAGVHLLFVRNRVRPSPHHGRSRLSSAAALLLGTALALGSFGIASADPAKPASSEDGKYSDAQGAPTYNISADGKTVDWYTFSGYRRYHSECSRCHGPDGLGSSYAPALVDSLKHLDYSQFTATVVQGRKNMTNGNDKVMPSFAEDRNVMCYLDDIYVYLHARSDGALPRIRPEDHEPKSKSAKDAEDACMGPS